MITRSEPSRARYAVLLELFMSKAEFLLVNDNKLNSSVNDGSHSVVGCR